MDRYGLADMVVEIAPYGCIKAGDWKRDAPWRKKTAAKWAAKAEGQDPNAEPRAPSGKRYGCKTAGKWR